VGIETTVVAVVPLMEWAPEQAVPRVAELHAKTRSPALTAGPPDGVKSPDATAVTVALPVVSVVRDQ
jgi:hypothetical protein